MSSLDLTGCRPEPLAGYLKALGILRLVAEQTDATARGWWSGEWFQLQSRLDAGGLEQFFLHHYEPTPLVGPWNGSSGFYPKDNPKDKPTALKALRDSTADRFAPYREAIAASIKALADLGLVEKPDDKDRKEELLALCRGRLTDRVLPWLDAAYLLTTDGAKYPPLLGTGGIDGHLEFANNFMQRLVELFDGETGMPLPATERLLAHSLWGKAVLGLVKRPIGQFFPSRAGGANADAGSSSSPSINPWDYVLMLEGAVVFASAAVRRLGEPGAGELAFPFTVRLSGVGYGSASSEDEKSSRGEIWMPLWQRPTGAAEVRALFAEGRARVGRNAARTGVDFARAIATLGVDRGIGAFQRFGFQVRNGLAYFATPMGRYEVRDRPGAHLLQEIDGWLNRLRQRATGKGTPAAVARALRAVDESIFALCENDEPDRVRAVLVALGRCERTLARSLRWANDERLGVTPVPLLSGRWLEAIADSSSELRLAAALASLRCTVRIDRRPTKLFLRQNLEPVGYVASEQRSRFEWRPLDEREAVWNDGHLVPLLNELFRRRLLHATRSDAESYPDWGPVVTDLAAIADFIEGRVDEELLVDLLWGCCLIDPTEMAGRLQPRSHGLNRAESSPPGAFYALLKLCFANSPGGEAASTERAGAHPVPVVPRIHRLAAAGAGAEAVRAAIRRLRASGHAPLVRDLAIEGELARRTAAALIFPLGRLALEGLRRRYLRSDVLQTEVPTLGDDDE